MFSEINWDKLARIGKDRKTEDEVFDRGTLDSLYKLMEDGELDTLDFPLSTGKEGNVFRGTCGDDLIAVKIYRISTATFKHIGKYLPTHGGGFRNRRQLIYAWARREYSNLMKLWKLGVRVPQPSACVNNVVIMEYMGTKSRPAPLLHQVVLPDPVRVHGRIVRDMGTIYRKAHMVHADLSEYNVLLDRGIPRIIDVGQMVTVDHPQAEEFLARDVANLARYFCRYFPVDAESVLVQIRGE
jgi:RIO kinase 1